MTDDLKRECEEWLKVLRRIEDRDPISIVEILEHIEAFAERQYQRGQAAGLREAGETDGNLRDALREVVETLENRWSGVTDTIWYSDTMTLVEFIAGVLEYNPAQEALPLADAQRAREVEDGK